MNKLIRVAVVDDEDKIREKLIKNIDSSSNMKIVVNYFNAVQAINDLYKHDVDVVLMDIAMPGLNGIDAVNLLKEKMPNTQFMMITVHDDDENIFNALRAGASGYLLKNTPEDKILEAIEDIYKGGSPMNIEIARRVVKSFHAPSSSEKYTSMLTNREKEIVELLCKGYAYKTIADQLYISNETVKKHIRNIYEKLHVQSKVEVIQKLKMNMS